MYFNFTKFTKTIIVKDEFYNVSTTKNMLNLVSDTNNNVYNVSNKLLLLFFQSSEILAQLEIKKKYEIKGFGIRVPYFDLYPNITSIKLIL
jgi:hypothetical protein